MKCFRWLFLAAFCGLTACNVPYNSPDRFLGRLDAHTLALIEPPPPDEHPDWPLLQGPDYSHVYAPPAYGPAHGTWGP